jgi:(R)-2-hydroxyacyl-CoA dehydratese activating ATPase
MNNSDLFFAGIDLGSTMTKLVIIDNDEKIRARIIYHSGAEHRRLANKVMEEALEQAGLAFKDIDYIVATGYGRMVVPFADRQITELTCHTRGLFQNFPNVRLAVDIGGQDSKVMQIRNGKLLDFAMNDKCAAGTGRFLEIIASTLNLKIDELGELSLKSSHKVQISSTCTVFAQQEATKRLSEGLPVEDIVAGIHDAIASRVARMADGFIIEPDVLFTGGVAKNTGVVKALEERLGCKILVPSEPLLSGALGAALLGKKIAQKARDTGEDIPRAVRQSQEVTFFGKGT